MRPYRGMTKDGKWVYGYWFVQNEKHYIYQPLSYPDKRVLHWSVEVLPETVGQQVGKKDRNGKEAYAGDKLKDSSGDIGVIYWKDSIAGFYCKWGDGSELPLNTFVAVNKCEIIGHIHEKPELLK